MKIFIFQFMSNIYILVLNWRGGDWEGRVLRTHQSAKKEGLANFVAKKNILIVEVHI
jgi:hypothetical protein